MVLRVVEDEAFKDIEIGEGEMFLLPGILHQSNLAFDQRLTIFEQIHPTTLSDLLIQLVSLLSDSDLRSRLVRLCFPF